MSTSLPAGTYQVSLNWGTNLDYVFSQLDASPTSPFWTSIADLLRARHDRPAHGQSADRADARSGDRPGVDRLDGRKRRRERWIPATSPSSVDLYQFTLAPGQLWEVGLDVAAESIGSPLQPALSLFDDAGNVLATSNSGTGLPQ